MKDNKKIKSFKIINKDKEGLTIIMFGKKIKLTWEEFKADYVMEKDKVTCHLNQKAQEKLDEADKLLTEGTMAALAVNSPRAATDPQWKVTNFSILGSVSEKLSQLMGLSLTEVAELIQNRLDSLKGVGFFKPKKYKDAARKKPEQSVIKGATQTLGDLPAMQELKKQYGL